MNRRRYENWLIVASIIAFAAISAWLALRADGEAEYFPPMTTYSPRPHGARALYELCASAGLSVRRFHGSEYDYPTDGCVVVLDSPDTSATLLLGSPLDVRALRLWLEEGGRLLLFSEPLRSIGTELNAAIDESYGLEPRGGSALEWEELSWSREEQTERVSVAGVAGGDLAEMQDIGDPPLSLLATQSSERGGEGSQMASWRQYRPGFRYDLSDDRPALWRDVATIESAVPDYMPPIRAQILLATTAPVEPLVLYRRVGRGEWLWVPRSEIAANAWLARADNHRLVLALAGYAAAGGPLYFDEGIHGYTREGPTPLALALHTKGGKLLLALLLVVLMLSLGAAINPARLHPRAVPPRRQASEMVLAQADLYRRAGLFREVGACLVDGLKRKQSRPGHGTASGVRGLDEALAALPVEMSADTSALQDYLRDGSQLPPGRLVVLARVCDHLRRHLRE